MKNKSNEINPISVTVDSLYQQENKLIKDLEKIREIRNALSILIKYDYQLTDNEPSQIESPLAVKQYNSQSGKNTINQALETKKKIINIIQSVKSASFSEIHDSIYMGPDTKYSPNTIRQYLSELRRSNKIKFNSSSKSYSVA